MEPGQPITLLAASAVADGAFTVRAADPEAASLGFFWEVKAIRADVDELVVEVAKEEHAGAQPIG